MKQISPKEALNRFMPLPCVFVISIDKKGKPSGMIASWVMQTSFNPSILAVAIGKAKFTYQLIKESQEFVIAIPNKKLEPAVLFFGTKSGRNYDKFQETGLKTTRGKFVKSPLLLDATLNYECQVVKEIDSGDHVIFLGKVVASWLNEKKKVLLNMVYGPEMVFAEF